VHLPITQRVDRDIEGSNRTVGALWPEGWPKQLAMSAFSRHGWGLATLHLTTSTEPRPWQSNADGEREDSQ